MSHCKLKPQRLLLLLALGLLLGSTGFAQIQRPGPEQAFAQFGVTITPQTREGQTEYLVAGTPVPVTLVANPVVNEKTVAFLQELESEIRNFSLIRPASVVMNLRAQDSTAVVRLSQLAVDGVNLLPLMPEGLVFRYTDALFYDFSMIVDNLRLRVRGQYFAEDELLAKLGRIYANPSQYLLSQDSEYVVNYLRTIEAENADLRARSDELLAENRALRQAGLELAEEISTELKEEFSQALAQQLAELEATRTTLDSSLQEIQRLESELVFLRDGVILLNTRGLFGGFNDFERNTIARLVDYRKSSPNATRKDAEAWLKEQGLSASGRLVQIALVVYFNQYQ